MTGDTGILKDNYGGQDSASNLLKEALRRRKEKLIFEGTVPPNPTYNSKQPEDDED